MNQEQKDRLIIDELTHQNTVLKIELAILKRELPTPDEYRKEYFRRIVEKYAVINSAKKNEESDCKG